MTEQAIIEFDVRDKDVLMAIFERFKVHFTPKKERAADNEDAVIKARLHVKYVETNLWQTMSDDDREDAAHAETLLLRSEKGEDAYLNAAETRDFLNQIEAELAAA